MGGEAGRFQFFAGGAAQGVDDGGGQEPGLCQAQFRRRGDELRVAEFAELFLQGGDGAFGVLGDFLVVSDFGRCRDAVFVGQCQREAVGCFGQ